jgi:GNAT superfamily N-acetyltransferase
MSEGQPQINADVTVRKATSDDVPVIHKLVKALAEYQRQGVQVSASEDTLKRDGFGADPQFECILAEIQGEAVGLAIFHPSYSTWDSSRGLFINDLFVSEVVRGQGVGMKLVREVAAIAKQQGCQHLELNVVHANPARNFYDRFGFVHVDDLLTYRLPCERLDSLLSE